MKFTRLALLAALFAGTFSLSLPARAQMGGGGGGGGDSPHINLLADTPSKSPDEIERDQARDKAYKDSLKAIPDAKVSNDPWGSVRSETPKAAAKTPTKPKSTAAKPKAGASASN